MNCIVEDLEKLLYPINFDKEGGKHNLIGLIMDKANYIESYSALFPRPNRPKIHAELIADGATGVIRAKAEAIHRANITEWDSFEAAEREARIFIINTFDKAWCSEMFKPVNFYAQVTTR